MLPKAAKVYLKNWIRHYVKDEDAYLVKMNPAMNYYHIREAIGEDEYNTFQMCVHPKTLDVAFLIYYALSEIDQNKRDIYFTLFADKNSPWDYDEALLIAQLIHLGVYKTDDKDLFFVFENS